MLDALWWLCAGAVIGGLASVLTRHEAGHAPWRNVAVGAAGAVLAGWIFSPALGRPSVNEGAFSFGALLVACVGAVIVLLVVNMLQHGRTQRTARSAPGPGGAAGADDAKHRAKP